MIRVSRSQMRAFEEADLQLQHQRLVDLCRDHYPKTFAAFSDAQVENLLDQSLRVSQDRGGVEAHWSLVKLAAVQANAPRISENPAAKLYFRRQVNRRDAEWEKLIDELHLNLFRYFPETANDRIA